MTCEEYYRQLYQSCGSVLDETFASPQAKVVIEAHQFLDDLQTWCLILQTRRECFLLEIASVEFQMALVALVIGNYRQAFMSLRFTLETSLAAIKLSTSLVDLALWRRGQRDIYWANIVDENLGVFSVDFVRAFFEELSPEAKHINGLAQSVYRQCSEFVHGNPSAQIPKSLTFIEHSITGWGEAFKSTRYILMFALALRYMRELSPEHLHSLEHQIIDELGHLTPIRAGLKAHNEETQNV